MIEFLVVFCALLSIAFLMVSGSRILSGNFNMATFGLLGISVFSLGDIVKYYLIERSFRPVSDELFLATVILILASTAIVIILGYPLGRHYARNRYPSQYPQKAVIYSFDTRKSIFLAFFLLVLALFFYQQQQLHRHAYFALINYALKAAVLLFLYAAWSEKKVIYLLFGILIFSLAAVDSSRRAYIAVFIPSLYIFYVYMRGKKISKFSRALVTFIVLLMIFLYLNILRSEHDFGRGYSPDNPLANTVEYITTMKSVDTFYNTTFVVRDFPQRFPYIYGDTYASVPAGIFPRSLWQEKPVGFAAILGMAQMHRTTTFDHDVWMLSNQYSLSPGFVGEAYANFGPFGVLFLSLVVGTIAGIFDAFMRKSNGVEYFKKVLILPVAIVIFRCDFYSATIYTIFIYIFFCILLLVFRRRNSKVRIPREAFVNLEQHSQKIDI